MNSCPKAFWWAAASILPLLAGGCFRGQDDSTFRVTVKPSPSERPAATPLPPLGSHTSGTTGDVTPYLPPPVSPQPVQSGADWGPPPSQNVQIQRPAPEVPTGPMPPPETLSRGSLPPVPAAELSAAVALPMTGPEGTMMGFSVDYQFRGGELPSGAFIWVIEGAQGRQYRVAVKLESRGNLMLVVPGWRPEDGPFRCRLEDQSGRPISPTVDMR